MVHETDPAHTPQNDDACSAPDCCALCGTPAHYFPLQASLLLDWILALTDDLTVLQDDLTTLGDHLHAVKHAVERGMLP